MQFDAEQQKFLVQSLMTMRIIAGALINGVVVFLVMVLVVLPWEAKAGPLVQTYIAIAAGCVALVLSFVIPKFIGGQNKQALVEGNTPAGVGILGPLISLFQTRLIVGYAILEGAAFYNVLAYMLERQPSNLAMVGLLLAAMVTKFPTFGRLENWLADEIKSINDLRALQK